MIRFCGEDVSPAQQGTCPVAKKAVFKNCESNQSVIGLANANFGLENEPAVNHDSLADDVGGKR
jgi:hypothetical protein